MEDLRAELVPVSHNKCSIPNGSKTTYTYDVYGNLIKVYDDTSTYITAEYSYDSLNRCYLEKIDSKASAKDRLT